MMMFTSSAAFMRWVIGGGMIVGMIIGVTVGLIVRVIVGVSRRCPDPSGRSCHRCRRVPALGIEARPADGIHRRRSRMPAIGGRELVAVQAGGMVMVELFRGRLDMVLVHGRLFLRRRPGLNARAAVEACVIIHDRIVDHGVIDIGIVNHCGIDIHHGGIVPEVPAMPFPAYKSRTSVAIAIIDAAIKTDMRSPIAAVPAIDAARVTPVTRCP